MGTHDKHTGCSGTIYSMTGMHDLDSNSDSHAANIRVHVLEIDVVQQPAEVVSLCSIVVVP
jgi:hypothetical protein